MGNLITLMTKTVMLLHETVKLILEIKKAHRRK